MKMKCVEVYDFGPGGSQHGIKTKYGEMDKIVWKGEDGKLRTTLKKPGNTLKAGETYEGEETLNEKFNELQFRIAKQGGGGNYGSPQNQEAIAEAVAMKCISEMFRGVVPGLEKVSPTKITEIMSACRVSYMLTLADVKKDLLNLTETLQKAEAAAKERMKQDLDAEEVPAEETPDF